MRDNRTLCECGHTLDWHSQLSGGCYGAPKTKPCNCNRFKEKEEK